MSQEEEEEKKEVCENPFRVRSRIHDSVKVDVVVKGRPLHVCRRCWSKLGKSDQEWTNPDW